MNNAQQRPRRTNGFSRPYTAAQVSTWIALPLLAIEFAVFVTPILPLIPSIVCTVTFLLFVGMSAYYAARASFIDPMDTHLAKHLNKDKMGNDNGNGTGFAAALGDGTAANTPESLKHCWICDTQVAEHAMHCKFCNKCIGHFDHHCMWLNTCVGKSNYQYFLRTMIYITAMLIVHCSIQIVLVVLIFLSKPTDDGSGTDDNSYNARDRANQWCNAEAYIALVSIYIVFVLFDLISLSLIGQLLYFHMGLRREGLTTYKYIVRETQRKRERTQQMARRHNQRIVAMSKANDEGRTFHALHLRYGGMMANATNGFCSVCDPLPLEPATFNTNQNNSSSNMTAPMPPPPPQTQDLVGTLKQNEINGKSTSHNNDDMNGSNYTNGNVRITAPTSAITNNDTNSPPGMLKLQQLPLES